MRALHLIAVAAIACCLAVGHAHAEKRVALVIGNDGYTKLRKLKKAVADAESYAEVLRGQDFDDVTLATNLTRADMDEAIAGFIDKIEPGDIAVFAYSGHGWSDGKQNFILGTDAPVSGSEEFLARISIPLRNGSTGVIDDMDRRGAELKVAIVDACRNNPFTPTVEGRNIGLSRGMTRIEPPRGTFVVFSAGSGQIALDRLKNNDTNRNSVFTRVFLPHLEAGIPLQDAIKETQRVVASLAETIGHEQQPAYYDEVLGDACIAGQCDGDEGVSPAVAALEREVEVLRREQGTVQKAVPGDEDALRREVEELRKQLALANAKEEPARKVPPVVVKPVVGRSTLEDVQARGHLNCGVSTGIAGFSEPDLNGDWHGLDADLCRAVAAAVFGDGEAVSFVPLGAQERFAALQSGEIDVLIRNTAWTSSRENKLELRFVGTNFHDGLAFMVPSWLGISSALELNGATVCLPPGTTTELEVARFFSANGMELVPVYDDTPGEVYAAYDDGRCDVVASDASALYVTRLQLAKPDDHVVLPERLTREQLGPYVRAGDDTWRDIVKMTLDAIAWAEERGVTADTVEAMRESDDPTIRTLLGSDGTLGESLGLARGWAVPVIKAVGNYGEYFERNVGAESPLGMERGQNSLALRGGLIAPPALR